MSENLRYAPMEPARSELVECAGPVRWTAGGKLQQLFKITDYAGSSPCGVRQEWRDVPTEQAPSPPCEGGR